MTPEQRALLKRAQESIESAKLLSANGFQNVAISRTYYAMFYVAQAFLLQAGLSFSKHAGVIAAFGQHFAKTGRVPAEFHRQLIEAHDKRNLSDYDTEIDFTEQQAQEQIDHAEAFLKLACEVLSTRTEDDT